MYSYKHKYAIKRRSPLDIPPHTPLALRPSVPQSPTKSELARLHLNIMGSSGPGITHPQSTPNVLCRETKAARVCARLRKHQQCHLAMSTVTFLPQQALWPSISRSSRLGAALSQRPWRGVKRGKKDSVTFHTWISPKAGNITSSCWDGCCSYPSALVPQASLGGSNQANTFLHQPSS